jgi:hypothetical protein
VFVKRFLEELNRRKVQVTDGQRDALWEVHPLLVLAAEDKTLSRWFWFMLRHTTREAIEWEKAKQMILKGEVVSVSTTHTLDHTLMTRDGRFWTSKAPERGILSQVMAEVDPKKVFIERTTE